jgi:cellulose synthase/poly-beta-1,6-N-acetylglucosamine synthase-like glycosyltransferase
LSAADTILALAGIPLLTALAYLSLLTVASFRPRSAPRGGPRLRFDLVVPAHDEEQGIARTVASLLAIDYPRDRVRVLVVADNCTDATAERAAAAGATVLVRNDPERRGKGYALEHAFAYCLADPKTEAVAVVDADTIATPNLLDAFSARIGAGAQVVQANYAILDSQASWRARLMRIAFATFILLRSLGRERLGLSAGLRGNGMCFTRSALRDVPHDAFSNVEDIEYAIRLGMSGIRVHFASEAQVYSAAPGFESAARTQRSRWEGGRRAMARLHGRALLVRAFRRRNPVLLDLAMDLLVPPLSVLASLSVGGSIAAVALSAASGRLTASGIIWLGCLAMLFAHVFRGMALSGSGARGLLDLAYAPLYIAWKAAVRLYGHAPVDLWVRTARDKQVASEREKTL